MRKYEHLLVHFNRDVLQRYRGHPESFRLDEDGIGGRLMAIGPEHPFHEIRYALRRLTDGSACIAIFVLDLQRISAEEQKYWKVDLLANPDLATDDPEFDAWADRHLEGSWEVQDGPIDQIRQEVALLSALTEEAVGRPLFRAIDNPLLTMPAAEDTESLKRAYEQISCLILDGLKKKTLEALAQAMGVTLTDSSKTLNSLKELLPPPLAKSVHEPLKHVRDERARVHGIQQAESCQARSLFTQAAFDVVGALRGFRSFLEDRLGLDAKLCMRRQSATKWQFPVLSGPPRPVEKLETLKAVEGKTIQSVQFGEETQHNDCHESEAIILEFRDGSALTIRIGSNALDLASKHAEMRPCDMHTDLMVFWKPSARCPSG
jgi:hypothetical protein